MTIGSVVKGVGGVQFLLRCDRAGRIASFTASDQGLLHPNSLNGIGRLLCRLRCP